MKIKTHRTHAISLVGAIIIMCFLVAIVGLILYGIAKLARKLNEQSGGGSGDTNAPTSASFEGDATPVGMFTFEIQSAPGETVESVAASIQLVAIERSTNLVDWQEICTTTNIAVLSDPASIDTNKPWPMSFYRSYIKR